MSATLPLPDDAPVDDGAEADAEAPEFRGVERRAGQGETVPVPSLASIEGRVRIRQLSLVAALSETPTLRRAAERINVSQPAATKMLCELERSLGLTLFERGARGMSATVYGEAVTRYAHLILSDLEGLREELAGLAAGSAGKVSVGTIPAAAPHMLASTIARLKARHPKLEVSVVMNTSDILLPLLEAGRLDIVIGRLTDRPPGIALEFEPLAPESLALVVGKNHPLATARAVTLPELATYSWILQSRASPMRQLIDAAFRDAGLDTPADVVETASVVATTALLQRTDMVAVVPESIAQHYAAVGLLAILPLQLGRTLAPFGMVTRQQRMLPPALREFMASLRAHQDR